MTPRFVALAIVAIAVAACGYRPAVSHGGGGDVCVPLAKNPTAYAGFEGDLAAQVRVGLASHGWSVGSCSAGMDRVRLSILEVNGLPALTQATGDQVTPATSIWNVRVRVELLTFHGHRKKGPWIFDADGVATAGETAVAEEELARAARSRIVESLVNRIVAALLEGGA